LKNNIDIVNVMCYNKEKALEIIMENNFINLIKTRQSCRDFNDKPLDIETIEKIASLATNSPSACNSQPWKMYLVGGEKVKEVTPALQNNGHNPFLSGAKGYIVITEKQAIYKEFVKTKFDKYHFVKYDIGELTAYITLVAEDMGVKSCIIGWINQEELRGVVGYSEEEVCNIVVALGYSDIPVREKKRKDLSEVIQIVK
jgi:nitroreductase